MNCYLHPFNNCPQLKQSFTTEVLCVKDRGIPYLSGVATLLRDPFSAGSSPDLSTISNLKVQVENQGKSSYLMSKTDIENIKNFVNSKQSCLKYHTKNEFMSICTLTNFPIPEINGAAITRVSTTKGGVYMILGGEFTPVPSRGFVFVYMIPPENAISERVIPARVHPSCCTGARFLFRCETRTGIGAFHTRDA